MKSEEWKGKIMDYLYDEMENEERVAFEAELKNNASLQKELDALQSTQNTLQTVKEEEISAPPFFNVHKKSSNENGLKSQKWILSIAASLVLILLAGKFTGLQVKYQKGLTISFLNESKNSQQFDQKEVNQ